MRAKKDQALQQADETLLEVLLSDQSLRVQYASAKAEGDVLELLRMAHHATGISQAELARRLDVSRARVSQVLSGEPKNLTVRLMGRIAGALGLQWRLALDDIQTSEQRFDLTCSSATSETEEGAWWVEKGYGLLGTRSSSSSGFQSRSDQSSWLPGRSTQLPTRKCGS